MAASARMRNFHHADSAGFGKSQQHKHNGGHDIQLYNAQLVDLAARRGCHYVSVPEALVDANGCLPADASGDGIHLNMTYSKYWADHICRTVAAVLRP